MQEQVCAPAFAPGLKENHQSHNFINEKTTVYEHNSPAIKPGKAVRDRGRRVVARRSSNTDAVEEAVTGCGAGTFSSSYCKDSSINKKK